MTPAPPAPPCGQLVTRGCGPAWIDLTPIPRCVSVARAHTLAVLTDREPAHAGDVALVASELVTNAYKAIVRHARPGWHPRISLGVQRCPTYEHLYVEDPVLERPERREPGDDEENGRGLAIVEALAAVLWTRFRARDKTVHAVIAHPGVELTEEEIERLIGQ